MKKKVGHKEKGIGRRKKDTLAPRVVEIDGRMAWKRYDGTLYPFDGPEHRNYQYLGCLAGAPAELPPDWCEETVLFQPRFRNTISGEIIEYTDEWNRRLRLDGLYVAIEMKQRRAATQQPPVDQNTLGDYTI